MTGNEMDETTGKGREAPASARPAVPYWEDPVYRYVSRRHKSAAGAEEGSEAERFDGLMQRYITFGFQGADPASETVYRAAGKVVYRRAGAQARGSVILAGGGVSQGCGVVGIEAAERADFRIELDCAPNTLWLDCQQRDDPGALWFTTSQRDIGPLEHVAGSVRCYDVPYVNW